MEKPSAPGLEDIKPREISTGITSIARFRHGAIVLKRFLFARASPSGAAWTIRLLLLVAENRGERGFRTKESLAATGRLFRDPPLVASLV